MSGAAGSRSAIGDLTDSDRTFLRRAIELGRRGWGRVHPNPMVGAVLAMGEQVIAEGHHEVHGGAHAEIEALARAPDPRGATLYVSLEPCRHVGKTPPCTSAVLRAGIARLVYWAAEPGSEAGGGGEWLRRQGLAVDGPFGERADWAAENPFFFHDRGLGRPYVALKLAISLDGCIAPGGGRRVWLTGATARREVHRLRAGFDAIMVGSRTWEADDPHLTARGETVPRVAPARILLDRRCRATVGLRALDGEMGGRAIVVTRTGQAARLQRRLGRRAEVLAVEEDPGGLDLRAVLGELHERGVASVLCEGGGILASSLLAARLVDRIYLFVAPVLIGAGGVPAFPAHGGGDGRASGEIRGWQSRLDPVRFGDDTLVVLERGE